jgi:tetratricopeptide (TPR) repeat protein
MTMKPHAFIAMPFGTKSAPDGQPIDFNRVLAELFKPALEAAGLEVFRADQERRAGDIRTDMFQELLMADLVLADLTLENPNVWYELGVRHALRARGVVLVAGGRVPMAFDLYTDRKLRYGLRDGGPNPDTLQQDQAALAAMVRATMESWHGRKISPVYQLLPQLREPDWKSLRIGDVGEFWERYDAWADRVELARKSGRIGDVLMLADEAPVAAFRAEAWIRAGLALRKAERFGFALEQLERGLEVEPDHLDALREKGICLQRLAAASVPGHALDRARAHYRNVLNQYPDDAETWSLLGRVDKDAWTGTWRVAGATQEKMSGDAAYEDVLLRSAIKSYANGFRRNPSHYYSGINALTLMHLYRHLTSDTRYDRVLTSMAGAIRFAAENERSAEQTFWAQTTLGDLEVLTGTPDSVRAAYKEAVARSENDRFALDSTRAQLSMLGDLGFQPANVAAGIAVFDRAMARLAPPEARWQPRRVLLFSGHLIDEPGRAKQRFPADKEGLAASAIAAVLDEMGAGPDDLALTQGACGGDLLFTEACLSRGVKVHWLQPFDEPEFIQRSVISGGEAWRNRYLDAKAALAAPPRAAPVELGAPPKDVDYAYARCNLWLLYTALSLGQKKVDFVCLWDGGGGDGPGGTAHMYREVERRTGRIRRIDTNALFAD